MSFYTNPQQTQGIGSAIGSFFQNLFKPEEQVSPATPALADPFQAPTYQIGPNDTSLDQVANSLNVPLQQLVDVNDGARTLPPVGSFMAVQPQNSTQAGRPIEAGAVPSFGQSISQMGGRGNMLPTTRDNTARGAYFTQLEVTNTQQLLQNGQLPPQITGAAAAQLINPQTGQPFTPQDFQTEGYQWDGNRYSLPSTTPAAAGASAPVVTGIGTGSAEFMGTGFMQKNAANQTEFSRQLRWDPERKRYVQLGTLIKEGRLNVRDPRARLKPSKKAKKKVAAPVVAAEASNAGDTPSKQLALQLGSG